MKGFFLTNNEVNEDTVMGLLFGLCAVVAGFMKYPEYTFTAFLSASLLFFGKNLTKGGRINEEETISD